MSYAVRNDGQGFRAVASKDDIGPDEWYSDVQPPDPVPLPPTTEEIIESVKRMRDDALTLAAIRIAPLQDAVDLDEATPGDLASLKLWKQYRIAVNRVDQQEGYPADIAWPKEPA